MPSAIVLSETGSGKATTAPAGPGPSSPDPQPTTATTKPQQTLNESMTISRRVPEPPEKGPGSGIELTRYQAIAEDFMEGMTVLEVRTKHGTGMAVAQGIRKHLGDLVPNVDTMAAQGFEGVRDLALKRIFEKLMKGEGKLSELSVVAGVSADKLDVLRGRSQPSQVHQHLHISHAQVTDILAALPTGDTQSLVHGPKSTVSEDKEDAGAK